MEYTPNTRISNFEIKKTGQKLASQKLAKKKLAKSKIKKNVGRKLARKISQLPHSRIAKINPTN